MHVGWQLIVVDVITKLPLEVKPGCIMGAESSKVWRAIGIPWCSLLVGCRAVTSPLERDDCDIETGARVGLGGSYEASREVAPVGRAVNLIGDLGDGLDRPQKRGLG